MYAYVNTETTSNQGKKMKTFKSALVSPVTLEVEDTFGLPGVPGVYLTIGQSVILLGLSDAPALALAILESAGFEDSSSGGHITGARIAVGDLKRHVKMQERANAEAKDRAELKAEALELVNAWRDSANYTPHTNWDALEDTPVGDHWLSVARKSRELRDSK